jgi:hypothetical protein
MRSFDLINGQEVPWPNEYSYFIEKVGEGTESPVMTPDIWQVVDSAIKIDIYTVTYNDAAFCLPLNWTTI